MATSKMDGAEKLVSKYFALIGDLRKGKEGSVEKLTELWDDDGVFEFAGSPPVTGTFRGKVAIQTLYKNRFHSSGMNLQLEAEGGPKAKKQVALGVVETDVHRTRILGEKLVAGWTTRIATDDGRGFNVSGSHTFTFKGGKIASLKVVVSPKADEAPRLTMQGLTINDIGRLSLAAWPVV